MDYRTGFIDLNGSGKDLADLYEIRTSGPTGTTTYLSQTYGKDLGSIFYMNANLGGLGLIGTTGTNCGYKNSSGIDIGSMFCMKGTVSSNPANNTNAINNLFSANAITPWGIYDASLWNGSTLPEARGQTTKDVTSTGTITFSAGASGNGATASIPSISGVATSKLTWPTGSWPSNFTICAITRYPTTATSATKKRILTSSSASGNLLLGHYSDTVFGYAFWTIGRCTYSATSNTNWLVSCAKNTLNTSAGTALNTVLMNGVPVGTTTGGSGGATMTINSFNGDEGDWVFTYLVIYDSVLTDTQMATVSTKLQNYLVNGYIS